MILAHLPPRAGTMSYLPIVTFSPFYAPWFVFRTRAGKERRMVISTVQELQQETLPLAWAAPPWWFNEAPSLLEAALTYARAGLPVFPVEPRGKAPLVPRGVYAATCDQRIIRQWWHRWPAANIGMPTGRPSGCWVLDVDPRHGGLKSLDLLLRDGQASTAFPSSALSPTRVQLSGGGGLHLWYSLRTDLDGVQFSNISGFAGYPGLDLKVAGGYVIAAPSRHHSGACYRWGNETAPLPFPDLLVERFRAHRQRELARPPIAAFTSPPPACQPGIERERDPDYWLRCALKYGVPGRRNTYAYFLACHLLDDVGMTPEAAEPYLLAYAQQVPQVASDYFGREEALSCLRSAARRDLLQEARL